MSGGRLLIIAQCVCVDVCVFLYVCMVYLQMFFYSVRNYF